MSKIRLLEDLPAHEKKYIEEHVRDIPLWWDPCRLRKLQVPTRYKWCEAPKPSDVHITPIECVTFEYKRVSVGEEPFTQSGLALIANYDVFVWWI